MLYKLENHFGRGVGIFRKIRKYKRSKKMCRTYIFLMTLAVFIESITANNKSVTLSSDENIPNLDDQRLNKIDGPDYDFAADFENITVTNDPNISTDDPRLSSENSDAITFEPMETNVKYKGYDATAKDAEEINNINERNKTTFKTERSGYELSVKDDHKAVTESTVYPYVVSILQKARLLSTGALISNNWVLTAADSLYVIREKSRELRVRLGCTDYKKGGIVIPVKFFEIHPYFDDELPEFDIAMIKLAEPVRMSLNIRPTRLQDKPQDVTYTHFIVTSWPMKVVGDWLGGWNLLENPTKKRYLQISHQHPGDHKRCSEYLSSVNVSLTENMMCLDPSENTNPCMRDVGAPVVLNGVLWGIVSSWVPEDCENDLGPIIVAKIAADDVKGWIEALLKGKPWNRQRKTKQRKYFNNI